MLYGLVIAVVAAFVFYWCYSSRLRKPVGPFHPQGPKITPIAPDFAWDQTEPKKHWPFTPKKALTMGLSTPAHQDWLLLENTYKDRVEYHKKMFESKVADVHTCLCDPTAEAAVCEVYDSALKFALARYPQYFQLSGSDIENKITGQTLPATSRIAIQRGADSRGLIRYLGENFEEEFLLLGFDEDVQEYKLRACTGVAAEGFLWADKMNLRLTDVHKPIPRYKEQLQFSMNKYFRKLEPWQMIQRTTFAVQVSDKNELYLPAGTTEITDVPSVETGFLRLERQVLTRLPKSGFIVFTIRTYMYPLSDIKAEGLGPNFVKACEAWPEDFAKYKGRSAWIGAVKQYFES